jgi:hypothetical protein
MRSVSEFTTRHGLAIRFLEDGTCQVIRLSNRRWITVGPTFSTPVEPTALTWTPDGIPASVLAVALRLYEEENPGTRLRNLLTRGRAVRSAPAGRRRSADERRAAGA